jgi:hypothetical protein
MFGARFEYFDKRRTGPAGQWGWPKARTAWCIEPPIWGTMKSQEFIIKFTEPSLSTVQWRIGPPSNDSLQSTGATQRLADVKLGPVVRRTGPVSVSKGKRSIRS